MTCGGTADTEGACHVAGERHSGADGAHIATEISHTGEVEEGACAKPGCHATADVRELHTELHCYTAGCHVEGGPTYMTCGGTADTEGACHIAGERHSKADGAHTATELAADGTPTSGFCANEGCHPSADVRELHTTYHCYNPECHVVGGPTYMSCGGAAGSESCHLSFTRDEHFVDHSADLTGTVGGVVYGPGANIGCLGSCHATDLQAEHRTRWAGGSMEGTAGSSCRVCHANAADPGSGTYAILPAVTAAIADSDRRCITCHSSVSGSDGPEAVESPTPACIPDTAAITSVEIAATPVAERASRLAGQGQERVDAGGPPSPIGELTTTLTPSVPSRIDTLTNGPAAPNDGNTVTGGPDDDPTTGAPAGGDTDAGDECSRDGTSNPTTTVPVPADGERACLTCHTLKTAERTRETEEGNR